MVDYKLYIFRRGGIASYSGFECDNDEVAAMWGADLANGEAAELWSGARKVCSFNPAADRAQGASGGRPS